MRYRLLGKTGMKVSIVAFGASPLGNVFGEVDEKECIRAVDYAVDHGINYFDVAPLYGFTLAEERLGKALRGKRDHIYLATKCCRDTFSRFDYSASRVMNSVDESLKRLQTDHVDVLQIHDVEFADFTQIVHETIPAARKVQESGKCRFVGITGLPVRYLRKLAEQSALDTILSWGHYDLVEDEMDKELTPICLERGIGLLNASPLHQRLLTESGPPAWHRSPEPVKAVVPALVAACRRYGVDIADVVMRFALDYPDVGTTIVGMSKLRHVQSNLQALDFDIPGCLLDELESLTMPVKNMMWYEGRPENNIPPSDPNRYVPREPLQTHDD